MIILPFINAHLLGFKPQREQMIINKYLQDETYIQTVAEHGIAWTGIDDGEVKLIAGIFQPHNHIGMAWAILSEGSQTSLFSMTKHIKSYLNSCDIPRIETAVRRDFKDGHRWANMLGFTNETPDRGMISYGIDGETYDLYARIK